MKNTTLCYIERDGAYLMLHKASKKNDGNDGKWMGIGGHIEEKESPHDCIKREALEETGLTLIKPIYRGLVAFTSDKYETELMHLFTCTEFSGEISSCPEGELHWIDKSRVTDLPMWEGDRIFLGFLDTEKDFFSLKLTYKGDKLAEWKREL